LAWNAELSFGAYRIPTFSDWLGMQSCVLVLTEFHFQVSGPSKKMTSKRLLGPGEDVLLKDLSSTRLLGVFNFFFSKCVQN
jgi:hypothetical protein